MEACDCGGLYPLREQVVTAQGKTCFAVSNPQSHKDSGMNAVGSVASLEWLWRIYDLKALSSSGQRIKSPMHIETISAKEDTERSGCMGKPLGCRKRMSRGLQCGLSGNPATV